MTKILVHITEYQEFYEYVTINISNCIIRKSSSLFESTLVISVQVNITLPRK